MSTSDTGAFLWSKTSQIPDIPLDSSGWFYRVFRMTTQTVSDEKRVLTIELPASVVDKLKARAKQNERSLAGELRYILTASAGDSNV